MFQKRLKADPRIITTNDSHNNFKKSHSVAATMEGCRGLAHHPRVGRGQEWSKVTGVMTGPMGELTRTMGQLADESPNATEVKAQIKVVKTDLFARPKIKIHLSSIYLVPYSTLSLFSSFMHRLPI